MSPLDEGLSLPACLPALEQATEARGFTMASDRLTGSLLRTLAASKPGGRLLELGTGTGISTCWLLDGMDAGARLTTVDNDPEVVATAREVLADPRVEFHIQDATVLLASLSGEQFDLIFADAWPGKFTGLANALSLLRTGGIYLIDDMLPQATWPPNHHARVAQVLDTLRTHKRLQVTALHWSTGVVLATKIQPAAERKNSR